MQIEIKVEEKEEAIDKLKAEEIKATGESPKNKRLISEMQETLQKGNNVRQEQLDLKVEIIINLRESIDNLSDSCSRLQMKDAMILELRSELNMKDEAIMKHQLELGRIEKELHDKASQISELQNEIFALVEMINVQDEGKNQIPQMCNTKLK